MIPEIEGRGEGGIPLVEFQLGLEARERAKK